MNADQHECYECGRIYDSESDAKRCNLICKTNYDMSH
jgi:rubredoxin